MYSYTTTEFSILLRIGIPFYLQSLEAFPFSKRIVLENISKLEKDFSKLEYPDEDQFIISSNLEWDSVASGINSRSMSIDFNLPVIEDNFERIEEMKDPIVAKVLYFFSTISLIFVAFVVPVMLSCMNWPSRNNNTGTFSYGAITLDSAVWKIQVILVISDVLSFYEIWISRLKMGYTNWLELVCVSCSFISDIFQISGYMLFYFISLFRIIRVRLISNRLLGLYDWLQLFKLSNSKRRIFAEIISSIWALSLYLHLVSCFWVFIGRCSCEFNLSEIEAASIVLFEHGGTNHCWPDSVGIAVTDFKVLYVSAFYWTVQTSFTVGFGDIVAFSWAETLFTIGVVFVGTYVIGSIIANIASSLIGMFQSYFRYHHRVDSIKYYMSEYDFPLSLRSSILHNLNVVLKQNEGVASDEIMKMLPRPLRMDLFEHWCSSIVEEYWNHFERAWFSTIYHKATEQTFPPFSKAIMHRFGCAVSAILYEPGTLISKIDNYSDTCWILFRGSVRIIGILRNSFFK